MAYRTTPENTDRLPGGIPYIIGNEAAERFSFYGMKAILTVYMATYLVANLTDVPEDRPPEAVFAEISEQKAKHLIGTRTDDQLAAILAAAGVTPEGGVAAYREGVTGADAKALFGSLDASRANTVFEGLSETNQRELYGVMSEPRAKEIYHLFVAATYFTPIFGAILADRFFGKYPVIIALSLFYCLGHGVLALTEFPDLVDPKVSLFAGLALIAVGAGGIKPCVSAHVGDQFGKRNANLLEKVYGWFYVAINVGAFVSQLLTPWVLREYGSGWAFGIPGVLMAVATFVFWLGRKEYAHLPPGGQEVIEDLKTPRGRGLILKLLPLYVFIIAFWMIFDQTGGAWVLQAEQMDRTINLGFTSFEILPSQVQAINPFYILLFVPFLSYVAYPAIDRIFPFTPLKKIGLGMFLTAVPFVITGWVEMQIQAGEKPSIWWHVLAYAVLTLAEVLVSVTTLEFSYTQAPKRMKSIIMGIYFLSVGSANLLVAQVNNFIEASRKSADAAREAAEKAGKSAEEVAAAGAELELLAGADYYWFFAAIAAAATLAFAVWSGFYRYETIVQGDDDLPDAGGRDTAEVAGEAEA